MLCFKALGGAREVNGRGIGGASSVVGMYSGPALKEKRTLRLGDSIIVVSPSSESFSVSDDAGACPHALHTSGAWQVSKAFGTADEDRRATAFRACV